MSLTPEERTAIERTIRRHQFTLEEIRNDRGLRETVREYQEEHAAGPHSGARRAGRGGDAMTVPHVFALYTVLRTLARGRMPSGRVTEYRVRVDTVGTAGAFDHVGLVFTVRRRVRADLVSP